MILYVPDNIKQTLPAITSKENPMVYARLTTEIGWDYLILSHSESTKAFRAYSLLDEEMTTLSYDDLVKMQMQYDIDIEFEYDFEPMPLNEAIQMNKEVE